MKLTDQQVEQFHEEGFVVVPDMVTEQDIAPVQRALEQAVEQRAQLLMSDGRITDPAEDEPFDRRMAELWRQSHDATGKFDLVDLGLDELLQFMACDNLLDGIESIVGPEITLNPIQHLRAKVPAASDQDRAGGLAGNVPWHQDIGVMWEEADDSNVVTCWMPLIDATQQTGCMAILPGVHKRGFLEHEAEGGTRIKPELIADAQPVVAECPRGGAVLMTRYTPHMGLDNVSDRVRWTLDLRYQPSDQPTGRPFHPAFVVRSRRDPSSVQLDIATWRDRWAQALEASKGMPAHRTAPKEQRVWAGQSM